MYLPLRYGVLFEQPRGTPSWQLLHGLTQDEQLLVQVEEELPAGT